ncbi:MAG TPA: ABC transporter substrate-binding protein [Burkholderiaceae bacterium]|nr:ABC transporter substrate-binding protein [Burkholderiaceae bacterium]
MHRRELAAAIALAGGGWLALSPTLRAQPATRVVRVGLLGSGGTGPSPWDDFREGLQKLGYVEGRNLEIVARWSEGFGERLPALAAELVALKVDVIAAGGTQATAAAMKASATIPIVMMVSSYPERIGLVHSLARPGGNVTGLSNIAPQLQGKRLELMREIMPALQRMACLYNPDAPVERIAQDVIASAAAEAGIAMQFVAARNPDEVPEALAAARSGGAQALLAIGNPVNFKASKVITAYAIEQRLPTMFDERFFVVGGGLMSYAPSFKDLFRRAATYVDKIVKGAQPAELPVEQPSRLELVINLKTAKALDLTIPQSVLLRADRLIQ